MQPNQQLAGLIRRYCSQDRPGFWRNIARLDLVQGVPPRPWFSIGAFYAYRVGTWKQVCALLINGSLSEEINRRIITQYLTWNFAPRMGPQYPCKKASAMSEPGNRQYSCGRSDDVMIVPLRLRFAICGKESEWFRCDLVHVPAPRRETLRVPLENIFRAILELPITRAANSICLRASKSERHRSGIRSCGAFRIHLLEPLEYFPLVHL
jgi:UDP-N-acetylglucosamine 2-epimerase